MLLCDVYLLLILKQLTDKTQFFYTEKYIPLRCKNIVTSYMKAARTIGLVQFKRVLYKILKRF